MTALSRYLCGLFTAASLSVGVALTHTSCASHEEAASFLKTRGEPDGSLLSARQANQYAHGRQPPRNLRSALYRVIDLAREARTIPMGRMLTDVAGRHGVAYGVDNDSTISRGYYQHTHNLLAMEFRRGAPSAPGYYDCTERPAFENARDLYRHIFYHELTHTYQHKVWHTGFAPEGLRSFDKVLWKMCMEAQANIVADIAMEQHRGFMAPPDSETLYNRFLDQLKQSNALHASVYKLDQGRLDDGQGMDVDVFREAFGVIPGQDENFLEGRFACLDDLYRELVFPNPALKAVYDRQTAVKVASPALYLR